MSTIAAMNSPGMDPPRAARWLESALIFTFFAHALGMASMALLLLRGIPGGSNTELAARATYIVEHPWLWRIGWLPWQLTAVSDLLLSLGLLRTPWIPRRPAILAILLTAIAIIPD